MQRGNKERRKKKKNKQCYNRDEDRDSMVLVCFARKEEIWDIYIYVQVRTHMSHGCKKKKEENKTKIWICLWIFWIRFIRHYIRTRCMLRVTKKMTTEAKKKEQNHYNNNKHSAALRCRRRRLSTKLCSFTFIADAWNNDGFRTTQVKVRRKQITTFLFFFFSLCCLLQICFQDFEFHRPPHTLSCWFYLFACVLRLICICSK